jgi:ABC-type polysaccharide/polyol phosphate transport system ATPase subunit
MGTTPPPAVVVDDVHKCFEIPREQVSTLKERALHPFRSIAKDVLPALRGVSFEVAKGEFFGVVGRNGSGKSTLLKCLAGIYGIDRGGIYVNGRMSTFIELGVGFNPDLPARDNALLNATMLGLSPREARRRLDSVVDFAELHDFVDLKIKNYSSGMLVRLAFSVMVHVDAEILLIDEVLAVGDAAFQQKCFDEFERIHASGATVLFVTHDMGAVQRFCDRAVLLEHGRQVELGDPEHVGNRYLELNFSAHAREQEAALAAREEGSSGHVGGAPAGGHSRAVGDAVSVSTRVGAGGAAEQEARDGDGQAGRDGDGQAEILAAWLEDERGERAEVLQSGRRCTFAAQVRFNSEVEDPLFGINVHNAHRDNVLAASNLWTEPRSGTFAPGEQVVFRVSFENVFTAGRYFFTPAVARQGGMWIDRRERMVSVVVTGTRASDALVDLPYEVAVERGGERLLDAEPAR